MSNIVSIKQATMTSLELVEYINSEREADESELRHDNFMAKVPKVLGNLAPKFLGTVQRPQPAGGFRDYPCYIFPKREACLMAMSYSYDLQAKVFDKMTALEQQAAKPVQLPGTYIEALEHLLASKKSEQVALADRDRAIATKAEIGSRREASAMATASAAVREVAKLKSLMGEAAESASILAVQSKTGIESFDWKELKGYCTARGLAMKKAFNPRLQLNVNTYPAEAWSEVYGIDIQELFATRKAA